ncbi:hypothetical protein EDD29_7741 [Actinocorallia herbida]|uniref:Uncharacterized protein n=1 Tax=Actinocorallia herbida TaxID=58109 RepID=A0A3N1DA96_9ACTN|nr:hypothetical protein [Actinocorallia herbida]ROO90028.1 hypothetical protein EDD29_7741 [Actinocorallia herbida]
MCDRIGTPPPRSASSTANNAPRPLDQRALRASFPEVLALWFGESTRVWRALVPLSGRDTWITAPTLETLGHALWTTLRTRPPSAPALPGPYATRATPFPDPARAPRPLPPHPAPVISPAPGTLRAPTPRPAHTLIPAADPPPQPADDYRPGLDRSRRAPAPKRPGLLARFGNRLRSHLTAA